MTAILRKEIASYLVELYTYHKGLFSINSVETLRCETLVSHYSAVLMRDRICTRENRVKEGQHKE